MESYGFFNGDTEYGQDEFNRYFNNLYENGISIDDTGKMTLSAAISGSSLKVSAGFAIINGFFYYNDAVKTLPITRNANYTKIDRLVLQLDYANKTIGAVIKSGTASSGPTAPALTRNNLFYELSLYAVRVPPRTYMKKVGILENSTRGVWALTTSGRELQAINSEEIVKKVREMTSLKVKDTEKFCLEDQNLENDGVDMPDEIQTWREKLKNVLKNLKPDAFERLTQRLLRESGFTQVKVTGRTGDGGIDGMGTIKLNGIISFHMLFQCKRYVGTVSASEIRDLEELCKVELIRDYL